jgi:photosystem II stability/assembly factor-like uncharacterized protein
MRTNLTVLAAVLVCLNVGARGQSTLDPKPLNDQPWRSIGPAVMGGRIDDVAVVESDPATAYIATATAGVWKTTNHGTTFRPVFDDQPCQSIGAVAVSPSDPSIVWVGTGESNNRQSSSWGCGVFKSTDAGATWQHMGLADTLHIARIVIDPRNPDVVYVAAVGHLWGANEERGLNKTTDGGKTWKAILQVNADTGCTDVVINRANPDMLWAAMYQRRRAAWGFIGGGPGSGIYRTTDAGATWTKLEKGLPAGDKGRIGLDVYRKDPRIVYAVVEAREGGVFRSEDGGDTWTRMSSTNPRPMYFSLIRVDPNDDQFVWLAGVSLMRSKDGGKTFGTESGARLHADIHAIWIDPTNSKHMLVGCDGGIQWSHDRGQTWDHYNNIPLAQFYHVAFDMQKPYWVAGGLQDNGCWMAPSSNMGGGGPGHSDWRNIGGGDGFYCAIDPADPNTVYSESQNGAVQRVYLPTRSSKSITPTPEPGEPPYRWDWCTPFMLSPHSPKKVLLGGNRLFISTDRGDTWRRTDDLTTKPNLRELVLMGVKRGNAYPFPDLGSDYGQIVTLTESPVREGVIYVGTDDGNLQVSRDDGRTWTNVAGNVPGVPKGTYVSRVHASPHAEGRVYAAFDGHRSDDYTPYAFVSEDFGATWRKITQGIPQGSTVNVVRDHPRCPNLLFAGTDRGLYVSTNRGATWSRFGSPFPPLRVDEVLVHPRENDLIVATHARGIYILDDIAALVASAGGFTGTFALLPPRPAVMYRSAFGMSSTTGNRVYVTQGAPQGAVIRYWLKEEPKADQPPVLTIEDRRGRTLRTRRLALAGAGFNTTSWDFREDPPGTPAPATAPGTQTTPRGRTGTTASPRRQSAGRSTSPGRSNVMGPRVLPGTYVVRLTVGKETQSCALVVEQDPRITTSVRDQRYLYDLSVRLLKASVELQRVDSRLQAVDAAVTKAKDSEAMKGAAKPLSDRVSAFQRSVKELSNRVRGIAPGGDARPATTETLGAGGQVVQIPIRQPTTLAALLGRHYATVQSVPEVPSPALRAQIEAKLREAQVLVRLARDLEERGLNQLNADLTKAKLPVIEVVPVADSSAAGAENEAEMVDAADG